jgi:hypothetical protein
MTSIQEMCALLKTDGFYLFCSGTYSLEYKTGEGSISEVKGKDIVKENSDEKWKCKEGYTVSAELRFSKVCRVIKRFSNHNLLYLCNGFALL